MQIDFEITSYHRLSPEQNSDMSVINSATFGRSTTNDWYLPDPDKIISGVHARVEKYKDGFHLYDESTNGVFINRSVEALGANCPHKLQENDIVSIGDYEIVVNKITTSDIVDNDMAGITDKVNASDQLTQSIQAMDEFSASIPSAPEQDFSLKNIDTELQDHFPIPDFSIPSEWEIPLADKVIENDNIAPATAIKETITSTAPITVSEPVLTSKSPEQHAYEAPENSQKSVLSDDNCRAFLAGLGISDDKLNTELSPQVFFELGESMSLLFLGLINTLRNRSSLKSEFKINQTTFQHKENNPLKFSANIDDVFQNLYLTKSNSFLPAKRAIESAFTDIEHHDKALTSAGFGALQGLLKELQPEAIEDKTPVSDSYLSQFIKSNAEANCWKNYKKLHEYLQDELSTQGNIALNDDFVKTYDDKIKTLNNQ